MPNILALLRRYGLHQRHCLLMHRSELWNSEIKHRHILRSHPQTRHDGENVHTHCHGRYPCYIRPCRVRYYDTRVAPEHVSLSEPHPARRGSLRWSCSARVRIFHRDYRRQWRQRDRAAAQTVRGHDVDVDLCGGVGDLWNDRCTSSKCQRPRLSTLLILQKILLPPVL